MANAELDKLRRTPRDRFKAGDSLEELADDYGTSSQAIEEAIRCELDRREAA